MNPNCILPEEVFPAAIRLLQWELLPYASLAQQRTLSKVARVLAKEHRKLRARWLRWPPPPYVGLLPPRDVEDLDTWGKELRWRRRLAGLSRRQLAELTGASASTIRNLETGRHQPTRAVVMQLQAVPALGHPSLPESVLIPLPRPPEVAARLGVGKYSCGCWFATEYDAVRLARSMTQRFNGIGGHIDQTFLYSDLASAVAWCAVTAQADYPQWRLPLVELAQWINALVGTEPVDIIGLGAGEAKEEVRLVQALLGLGRHDLRLFLLDISQPLLSAGYKHAAKALKRERGVGVFAIQGDFHHLPSYTSLFEPISRRRVLCMFGDTFCTLENEVLFLRDSLCGLMPGDLFLVDVPLAVTVPNRARNNTADTSPDPLLELLRSDPTDEEPDQLTKNSPGILGRLHDFLVGPFRRYVRDVQSVSLSKELAPGVTLVPGSYAVDFRAHVETASGRERVFSVGGTNKHYDPLGLCACLRRQGFERVQEWRYASERHPRLLFIFRKVDRDSA